MPKISLKAQSIPSSPIRKLVPLADAAAERGLTVYHLNIGQPDVPSPSIVFDALHDCDMKLVSYTNSAGNLSYRKGLAKYYQNLGLDVDHKDIIVTTGGSEAISIVIGITCDKGDDIIVCEPFYTNYKTLAMLKTRHNEVAPNQFECAPEFCEANLAVDQNNLLMILMRKIASRHHLRVIFHEKPFAGVNGSGKHCNWSMCTDKGTNLLSPSATPGRNLQFLSVLVSVLRGVYKHHYLMMAGVASLNNFYRLGGNEAPPAIMSVFIGSTIDKVLNEIDSLGTAENDQATELAKLDIVNKIPEILPDNTDRNRTSPFAFTGNRFEFRAVGSSVNVASADYILNTIVAEQLTLFRQRVDTYIRNGVEKQEAIMKVIREFIVESKPIRFEGNGYSDEWRKEAAARGLRGINDVPEAYDELVTSETVEMFESQGVLSREEIEARREVLDENFTKKLQIESRVMCDLTINHIIPTAIKYQNVLLKNVQMMKDVLGDSEEAFKESAQPNIDTIKKISGYIGVMHQGVHDMVEARKEGNKIEDYVKKAHVYSKTVLPYMDVIRDKADKLEMIVDDELWPLPKYRELQFLK